jgi:hypothetical protein
MLRFFYNGIKADDGKLQRAWYSDAQLLHHPTGTITIYARGSFTKEISEEFIVTNDSDLMTDYFEHDRMRVEPDDMLYAKVKEALGYQTARAKWYADKTRMIK